MKIHLDETELPINDDFDYDLIDMDDSCIDMKCIKCGYEEQMPSFVYGEEAGYLREIGETQPPGFHCIKCHKDTLYKK